MPAAIEEYRCTDAPGALVEVVGRERPLILRGLVSHWPVVAWARASDTAFARGLAALDTGREVDALLLPPGEDGCIGYSADLSSFNYEHYRVPVTDVLKRLAHAGRASDPPGIAMQSALIADCVPGLLADHLMPLLDASIQPRLWIGNRVTTPVHFDEFHNIACVVCGARRFTLFPPGQVGNLYIGPLDFAPTGAAISMARLDRPDDPRFPRLQLALAQAQTTELEPGDAIYIPPMWWHHVASLGRLNALINYWWKPAPDAGPTTGLGALMHAILAFRSLSSAERMAWRGLLDYYAFDAADAAEHIPAARRGMLGALTPEQAAALREKIRRYL